MGEEKARCPDADSPEGAFEEESDPATAPSLTFSPVISLRTNSGIFEQVVQLENKSGEKKQRYGSGKRFLS